MTSITDQRSRLLLFQIDAPLCSHLSSPPPSTRSISPVGFLYLDLEVTRPVRRKKMLQLSIPRVRNLNAFRATISAVRSSHFSKAAPRVPNLIGGAFVNSQSTASIDVINTLKSLRTKCTNTLKSLPKEFSVPISEYVLKNFCLENACLIFCTASTSSKLHIVAETRPLELLVIDEAAQLKECESAIPLQISGLRHAILVGDERQLPAMVQSKIAASADFGRSLFERLAKLGHKKHLLNIQYRMHPSISLFPKKEFYDNQIVDGPNVKETRYKRTTEVSLSAERKITYLYLQFLANHFKAVIRINMISVVSL